MARGRSLRNINHQTIHDEDAHYCPLCIEPLDSFERSWLPCGCGYQVCTFCYERLKIENNGQCPGCRQEYGSARVVPPEELPINAQMDLAELANPPQQNGAGLPQQKVILNTSKAEAPSHNISSEPVKALDSGQPNVPEIGLDPDVPASRDVPAAPDSVQPQPRSQEASRAVPSPDERDEGDDLPTEPKPKIQPTKIKTRPWAISETAGQPNVSAPAQSSGLTSSAWPVLGSDGLRNGAIPQIEPPPQNGRSVLHQFPVSSESHEQHQIAKVSSEASERLAAFLGEVAQKKQQQQYGAASNQSDPSRASSSVLGTGQAPPLRPLESRIIKPPPGYDQPLPHWAQNGRTQPPQADPLPPAPHPEDRPIDLQAEKFAKWWQTVNAGARQREPGPDSGFADRQVVNLPGSDSAHDLVRQAADAHGQGYPASAASQNLNEDEPDRLFDAFNRGAQGLAADGGGNDSAKSMEKLYNIWPPNARSNSDSGGPSSLSSTHNMWAVHKQANGVSALWNPQPSEPIPDSLQELWANADKPTGQTAPQHSQIGNGLGAEKADDARIPYQRDSYSPMPDFQQFANLQNDSQLGQQTSHGFQALNRNQAPMVASNGNLSGLSQGYGMRYNLPGMNSGVNQLGTSGGINQAQLGGQNQSFQTSSGLQAAQAYLQGLQLQAALNKQVSGNQQNLLQAQQNRFPAQTQNRTGFPQSLAGQNYAANGLTGHPGLSQHLNQGVANSNQTLGISQAYANQLLGQLGLTANQAIGANANQTANGLLANGRSSLQAQQYGLGTQGYSGGNVQLGALGNNLGLNSSAADLNALRLQQALQTLNLQSGNNVQSFQNLAAQERQRVLLEMWAKQQQQQQHQVFPQGQTMRQEQSRFAGQFSAPPRSMGQQFHQNLSQAPTQILQQPQHRLGRSGSPAGFQNPNIGNQMYPQ